DSRNNIATAKWFWIASTRLTLDSTVNYDSAMLKNVNHARQLLFNAAPKQFTLKQDMTYQPRTFSKVEIGYVARRLSQDGERRRFQFSSEQVVSSDLFSGSSWQPGAYTQHTVTTSNSRIAFTYGGRV